MPQIYAQHSASQSANSFSDGEEDDNNIFASGELAVASPATWYSRIHHVQTTARTPPHSPASHLPPEILINILKHLSSPRDIHSTLLVSRSWCECSVELLWHKPTVPDFNTLIKIMQVLSREEPTFTYSQFIRRLNFISVGSEMSDSIFGRLAPCVRLERLTLVGCSNLSDDVIARTVPHFPNLVAIDLSGVDGVTDRTVFALADCCPKLQGINLLGCRRVSSTSIGALAEKCPLLRRVKLTGLADLTDEPVSNLAIKGSLLLEIDLNGCKKLSDRAVRDIWTHSHNMREMRLSHCQELTDLAFPAPQNIREPPPGPNPFPEFYRFPVSDLPPLRLSRALEHLRMLDLTSCSKITDDAVEGIVSASPRLRNLVLSKCSQLTDRAIESICLLGKHLHYLHLGHASSITDRSVKTLARSCTRLRYIDLANCNQLTDMSVFELASLPKLRRIGLVRVSNLTDEAIYSLGDRHQTLERVHLSYCDRITVMAIHYLLQKLQKLNHLSLTGIPAFRRHELQQFCRTPPAEFNTTQRSQFCVFAGEGVNKLRRYLTDLFNSITEEMNPQGDEDQGDGDVGDSVSYVHDEESMDIDDVPPQVTFVPPEQRGLSPPLSSLAVPRPAPRLNGHSNHHAQSYQPMVHRHSTPIRDTEAPTLRAEHPNPSREIRSTTRSPAHSPPPAFGPAPGPSRLNPTERFPTSPAVSEGSSAGAFFRTYQSSSVDGRADGALTPDLVFAEIGHGHGPVTWQGQEPDQNQTYQRVDPATLTVDDRPQYGTGTPQTRGGGNWRTVVQSANIGQGLHGANGVYHAPGGTMNGTYRGGTSHPISTNGMAAHGVIGAGMIPTAVPGPPMTREERSRGRPRTSRDPQESSQATATLSGQSQGRGPKRTFRSTLDSVEQHAASFLFGRPLQDGEGSTRKEDGARGY
ncbi:hypothetical protein EDB84DRAFT_1556346 [Lactarius hengduanensis]|nr:hypothetical protein EDB84DRAFT_1556346 [Lactarius hengduanensis]